MSNDNSALWCGCDPGCGPHGYVCERHKAEGIVAFQELVVPMVVNYPAHSARIDSISKEDTLASREAAELDQKPSRNVNYEGISPMKAGNGVQTSFTTGATRSTDVSKVDYEGHINPEVLAIFGDYMHAHRVQRDGQIRTSDNWQQGIPVYRYVKSLIRHTIEFWRMWRGYKVTNQDNGAYFTLREVLSAILFNVMGIIYELEAQSRHVNGRQLSVSLSDTSVPGMIRRTLEYEDKAKGLIEPTKKEVDDSRPNAGSPCCGTVERVSESALRESGFEEGSYRVTIERERY